MRMSFSSLRYSWKGLPTTRQLTGSSSCRDQRCVAMVGIVVCLVLWVGKLYTFVSGGRRSFYRVKFLSNAQKHAFGSHKFIYFAPSLGV